MAGTAFEGTKEDGMEDHSVKKRYAIGVFLSLRL